MFHIAAAPGLLTRLESVSEHLAGLVRLSEAQLETTEQVAAGTAGADAVVVALHPLGASHIDALDPGVRVIGRAGVGLDSIDLAAAARRNVAVINQPGYATAEVATHAVAMVLAAHRRLVSADGVARGDWSTWPTIGTITPIEEQTVGIVGGGRIGRAVIERLRPFAGSILVHDPELTQAPDGVELAADLLDLLSRCDIVSLHLPLTDSTRNLIDADTLKAMPEGAILVNVSRGGLVDEHALVDALVDNHLAGAALDVMADEPLPADSPLLTAPRLLLSPHIGWYSESAATRLWRMTLDGIVEYLSGVEVTAGNLAVPGAR